jgi:glucose-6-phosphate dehydrogenase assembly protein OpcA
MDSSIASSAPARHVDPAAIERELAALWRAEAEAHKKAGGNGKPLARTLLLNLLVFAPDQAAADLARDDVAALTGRQPSRAILMVADDRAPEAGIDAWVSIFCTTPQGNGATRVCGEQITVEANGPAILDLPGTILPLLLANLPTFLWWQAGLPFAHPIFDSLSRVVDRVVLDSLTFADPLADLGEVARAARNGRFPAIVTDLGWARLTPWRALTAQIFDPQAMRPYLNQLESVRVSYYEGSPAPAWLFAGWLASRLEWKLSSRESSGMRFADGQTIELATVPADGETPGYFAAAELRTRDGAVFEVARCPNDCAVTRLNVGGRQTEHVVPVRHETSAEWLDRELNRLAHSATFEAAVSLISNL